MLETTLIISGYQIDNKSLKYKNEIDSTNNGSF